MFNHESLVTLNAFSSPEDDASKILIIDDEDHFRSAYKTILSTLNTIVFEAPNGRSGLEILQNQSIDLLILDLGLPDISGLDILEWINIKNYPSEVIIFSANRSIQSAISALRRRVFDFLQKDSDPDEMLLSVERALMHRRHKKENLKIVQRLESSERMHRFLVDQSPDIIFNIDPKGFITFINSRVESILGYQTSELLGKHYSYLVEEQDLSQIDYIYSALRKKNADPLNIEIKLRVGPSLNLLSETSSRIVNLTAQGIFDDSKKSDNIGLTCVARDISAQKKAEDIIAFQAFHDLLTSLPNRSLFNDRLKLAIVQASRKKEKLAVMFFDLDRFKLVNDTYGHCIGDSLLMQLSQRITSCLRAGDTLARLGGDEFTALIPSLKDVNSSTIIAEKIINNLKLPFQIANVEFLATVSIGISIFPDHGATPDELLRHADMAMYDVKSQGKNGYGIFNERLLSSHNYRISLENDLRNAIGNQDQFELYFQPQINTDTNNVIGLEALMRWKHPKLGMVSPDTFIPIAEEAGLITSITDWVLHKVCATYYRLNKLGFSSIKIGLNVSSKDFERSDFCERIKFSLEKYKMNPKFLDIEIVESLLMKDVESIANRIRILREMGLQISIDDFGTRYSSLNYLRRFSVNRIKIDQSFVRDLGASKDSVAIIKAIIDIAKNFKLKVMAEGVENSEHMLILRELGCYEMQGYFFSKPLPIAETITFLEKQNPNNSFLSSAICLREDMTRSN